MIAGPTAVGKTTLAIEIAIHFGTEIISADSRQFYKEMNIGTAKPTAVELAQVKHHFIDNLSVTDYYTAGMFEKEALKCAEELFKKYPVLVMVGGSGLFIQSFCNGMDEIEPSDLKIREELNNTLTKSGLEYLQERLKVLDPEYYLQVDLKNPQRVIRALEVCISTGKPYSSFRTKTKAERDFNIVKIGLNTSREVLYERINKRVDDMMQAGLLEEVRGLYPDRELNALQTVGYTELFDYLDTKIPLGEAIALIKRNSRRYAKRQLTWFKRDPEIVWFEPSQLQDILNYIHQKI